MTAVSVRTEFTDRCWLADDLLPPLTPPPTATPPPPAPPPKNALKFLSCVEPAVSFMLLVRSYTHFSEPSLSVVEMFGPPNISIRSDCVVTFFLTVAVTVPYDRLLGFSAVPAAGLSTRSLGGGVLSAHPPTIETPTTTTAPRAINRCI